MADSELIDSQRFLPWQQEIAQRWLSDRARFAHAWLIHGRGGIGKVHFARAAAASLLCENPNEGVACTECQACLWFRHGNHPDFRAVRPDAVALTEGTLDPEENESGESTRKTPSREIRIEQVRGLEAWAHTATHRGGQRVALIYPGNTLNPYAANALLKLLEEPPPGTVFLLVVDALDSLLPTLVSRCRRLPLPMPAPQEASAWLQALGVDSPDARLAAAGGAPMQAWRTYEAGHEVVPGWLTAIARSLGRGVLSKEAPTLATELEKQAPAEWLEALQRLLVDIRLAQAGCAVRYYPKMDEVTRAIARRFSVTAAAEGFRWLTQQRGVATHPLNPRLFAHMVLIHLGTLAS